MSSFENELTEQIKAAMRAKDQLRLDTLRAMKSALKYKMVELKTDKLDEQEAMNVFRSLMKQRKEAAETYEKSGQAERAQKEMKELEVIASFLPAPMAEEELKKIVDSVMQKLGASSMKDMGAVMKEVMAQTQGRADGSTLSQLVRQKLSG